jgi:hypothetical protein
MLRGNSHPRQHDEVGNPLAFDGGDDGHVRFAARKLLSALRGQSERQIVFSGERAVGESPDEGRGVQILHSGDVDLGHGLGVVSTRI